MDREKQDVGLAPASFYLTGLVETPFDGYTRDTMATVSSQTTPLAGAVLRVAFYKRVSPTEGDGERETIKNQSTYLHRKYAADFEPDAPNPMQLVAEFADDQITGALPLIDRPDGRRLLEAARAGMFDAVIVYRLDRLGRSIRVLLDAHDELARHGVAILSATEPFDTRQSIGRFVFHLLGSLAELERSTIKDRMSLGRDRINRDGRFISGPIPYGYDVVNRRLVPSSRLTAVLGADGQPLTESGVVRAMYANVLEGWSSVRLATWLNAVGAPAVVRYHNKPGTTKVTERPSRQWTSSRVRVILTNTNYRGVRQVSGVGGAVIEQPIEPLVDDVTWYAVQRQLTANRARFGGRTRDVYLLTGKITCGAMLDDGQVCGRNLVGVSGSSGGRHNYYRCTGKPNGQSGALMRTRPTCPSTSVRTDYIEALVLDELTWVIEHPQDALDELRAAVRAQNADAAATEDRRRQLHATIAEKEAARRDVLALVKERAVTVAEAKTDLDALAAEITELRHALDRLATVDALADALEAQFVEAQRLLETLRGGWPALRDGADRETLARMVQTLTRRITIIPGQEPRREYAIASSTAATTVNTAHNGTTAPTLVRGVTNSPAAA